MAKQTKSRRSSGMSKAQPRSYSELYGNRDVPGAPAPAQARAKSAVEEAAPKRGSDSVDWRGEYGRVFGDIRQLLVISALLFGAMIVLGYVM